MVVFNLMVNKSKTAYRKCSFSKVKAHDDCYHLLSSFDSFLCLLCANKEKKSKNNEMPKTFKNSDIKCQNEKRLLHNNKIYKENLQQKNKIAGKFSLKSS